MTKNVVKGFRLRFLFSYGSNQTKKLIHRYKKEYKYDSVTMIRDERSEKTTVGPAIILFIYRYLRQNK